MKNCFFFLLFVLMGMQNLLASEVMPEEMTIDLIVEKAGSRLSRRFLENEIGSAFCGLKGTSASLTLKKSAEDEDYTSMVFVYGHNQQIALKADSSVEECGCKGYFGSFVEDGRAFYLSLAKHSCPVNQSDTPWKASVSKGFAFCATERSIMELAGKQRP